MEVSASTAGLPIKGKSFRQGFARDLRWSASGVERSGVDKLGFDSGEQHTVESALIANLVWIKSDLRALAVEENLEKTIAFFEPRVYRNRRQIRKTRDEVLRLVALYCVLQVALLLCVAYSHVLQCRNLWTPFWLSALSSIITFRGVFQKYRTIGSLEDILTSEDQILKVAVANLYKLRREGPKYFESCDHHRGDSSNPRATPAVIDIFVVLPLVSFSVIILASFWHMLCKF